MHTLCLPVVSSLADVYAGVDVQAAICLLANMGESKSGTGEICFSILKTEVWVFFLTPEIPYLKSIYVLHFCLWQCELDSCIFLI